MTARVAVTMRQVVADCATDAQALDGTPFTARAVAEIFGNTLAMLSVVAEAVALLAEKEGREEATEGVSDP